ncbi:MAG: hypothetical protein AB7G75_21570 [Candidatus Binatia bacterium]
MKRMLAVVTFVVLGWADILHAQPATSFDRPVKLLVTGEVLPFVESPPEDIVTAKILIQEASLLLRVGRVEELTSAERMQAVKWGILFREVRFTGPDSLLEQIRKTEGTGKVLTIEGQLDTKTRQFLVSAVKEAVDAH